MAVVAAPGMPHVFDRIADDTLACVLDRHAGRCYMRSVDRRWSAAVEANFAVKRYLPPKSYSYAIDFEVDQGMHKHLYAATFEPRGDCGDPYVTEGAGPAMEGIVSYMNWLPAYFRSSNRASKEVCHRLGETDACALWRIVARAREERSNADDWDVDTSPKQALGYLTITEGAERYRIGRLTTAETKELLRILDYKQNESAGKLHV